jgi:hypothetical protein
MGSSLSDFLAHIKKNNIVRSNRFRITFALPAALVALIGGTASTISTVLGSSSVGAYNAPNSLGVSNVVSLTCMSTDIPGITIHTTESNYGSLPRQIVNGRSYDNFSTSFLLTGAMIEKKLLDGWYNITFNDSNNSINYYDDYVSSLMVEQLDQNDNVIYVFELLEAFPVHVGDIKLDRTSTNQQATLDVNWMFHRIKVDPDSFSLSSLIPSAISPSASLDNTVGSGLNNLNKIPTTPSTITSVPLYTDNGSRVNGIISNINGIIGRVKEGSISNLDGVKLINSSYRDFNSIPSVPSQVKADVLVAVNTAKSQMSNMSTDPSTITT